ncbi:MAG: HAD family hydrolase [Acholeplasma sp.]
MRDLEAVIFDLDGTLLDTLDDITNSVNYTMKQLKLHTVSKKDVRSYLGNGAQKLWQHILKAHPTRINEALDIYIPYLENHAMDSTRPYDGIVELLKNLKKSYKLGVVSNKHQNAVEKIIKHYFNDMFDCVIGEQKNVPKKPDPAPLNNAIKALGTHKENVIFIGDSEVDIKTAKHANVTVIGVTWGFRDIEKLVLETPNYLINNVSKIQKIIGE